MGPIPYTPQQLLTSSGGHRITYGLQAGGTHPTGMLSVPMDARSGDFIKIFYTIYTSKYWHSHSPDITILVAHWQIIAILMQALKTYLYWINHKLKQGRNQPFKHDWHEQTWNELPWYITNWNCNTVHFELYWAQNVLCYSVNFQFEFVSFAKFPSCAKTPAALLWFRLNRNVNMCHDLQDTK